MKNKTAKARAIADIVEGTILASVSIRATIERVFQALTDPEELPKWWGEDGLYHTTKWTHDFRVGGKWRADGMGADGSPFYVEGEYVEIDAPRKIVKTWSPAWEPGPATTITYRLSKTEEGTLVTVKHTGFGERTESCASHASGWERVLSWLERFASNPAEPSSAKYYFCRLIPPRPTFAFDMSEKEKTAMLEHVAYWKGLLKQGKAIVFGPVGDPSGPWGLGVLCVANEAELRTLQQEDPALRGEIGLGFEALPMIQAVH